MVAVGRSTNDEARIFGTRLCFRVSPVSTCLFARPEEQDLRLICADSILLPPLEIFRVKDLHDPYFQAVHGPGLKLGRGRIDLLGPWQGITVSPESL